MGGFSHWCLYFLPNCRSTLMPKNVLAGSGI
jgi:hypothetical protein